MEGCRSNRPFWFWEDCGLDPPVLCTDSTLTLTPGENPQSCQDEFDRIIYIDFNCAAAGQSIVDTFVECGSDDAKFLINICGSNERGEQCLDVVINDDMLDSQCQTFEDNCTASCPGSLESIRNRYGCCAYVIPDTDVWSLCNVEAPGDCVNSTLVRSEIEKPGSDEESGEQ